MSAYTALDHIWYRCCMASCPNLLSEFALAAEHTLTTFTTRHKQGRTTYPKKTEETINRGSDSSEEQE